LIVASVVLIAIIIVGGLVVAGIIPLLPKGGDNLEHPETAWIAGLVTTNGTLILDGQTTAEKVLTIKGNVTNPTKKTASLLSASATYGSGCQLSPASSVNGQIDLLADRVFYGSVVLVLNNSQRILEVHPLTDSGTVDLWEFEGKLVLARGTNTFKINVLDLDNVVVGESRTFRIISNLPAFDMRITLTWDTNSSDVDMHVWHFPYIRLGETGGMDGIGGWWQWFGHWEGVPEQSEWIHDYSSYDSFGYTGIESWTWRNYSYVYNGQQYSYGDGVGHAWYRNMVVGINGAQIDVDDTDGYGPEIFTMRNARPGLYVVVGRMFDPHDCNKTTNANVMVELFEEVKGTFSHAFAPYRHANNVIQYPSGSIETHESDFPQATVTDWVAYSFYILPDKTVSAPVEKEIMFGADCKTSAPGPSYFRDRYFMLDHAVNIGTDIGGWTSVGTGVFMLERLGESGLDELIIEIERGGVGVQPGGIWQGAKLNIPPGLYRLSSGNNEQGPNEIRINTGVMSSP
jgi:hypothetical protein